MTDQSEDLVREDAPVADAPVAEDDGKLNPETIGKPRDETGRFVPQQALHASRQKEREASEQAKTVAAERDAERQARERLERELYELRGQFTAFQQQPRAPEAPLQPPPDWWTDPDAALKARLQPIEERLRDAGQGPQQVRESMSRMIALDKHGPEAVNAAYRAADEAMRSNPAMNAMLRARLSASEHPFGELVKWHKEQTALSRVGDDPDAFIEAEVARRLAGREQPQPEEPAQPRAPQPMPTNFANSRNAGARSAPAWGGPKPLTDIFGGR